MSDNAAYEHAILVDDLHVRCGAEINDHDRCAEDGLRCDRISHAIGAKFDERSLVDVQQVSATARRNHLRCNPEGAFARLFPIVRERWHHRTEDGALDHASIDLFGTEQRTKLDAQFIARVFNVSGKAPHMDQTILIIDSQNGVGIADINH